jgi:hypothetical protein
MGSFCQFLLHSTRVGSETPPRVSPDHQPAPRRRWAKSEVCSLFFLTVFTRGIFIALLDCCQCDSSNCTIFAKFSKRISLLSSGRIPRTPSAVAPAATRAVAGDRRQPRKNPQVEDGSFSLSGGRGHDSSARECSHTNACWIIALSCCAAARCSER